MQLGWDLGLLQLQEVGGGVLDVDRVVLRLDDEGGRSLRRGLDVRIGDHSLLSDGQVARVDRNCEIGSAAELVGSVDGVVEALVVVGADGSGQVGSGGKAKDADALWVDIPLGSMLADQTHGALGILEGSG